MARERDGDEIERAQRGEFDQGHDSESRKSSCHVESNEEWLTENHRQCREASDQARRCIRSSLGRV